MAGAISNQEKPWLTSYQQGVTEHINYEEICMPDVLDRTASKFPEKIALIFQGYEITYAQFKDMVDRFAACLAAFGVKKKRCRGSFAAQCYSLCGGLLCYFKDRRNHGDEQSPLFRPGTGASVQ